METLAIGRAKSEKGFVTTEAHSQWSTGYLARLREGKNLEIEREFLRPAKTELSRAGNGTKFYEISSMPDGVYEAESVIRSYEACKEYFRIKDGQIVEIYNSKAEALESLDNLHTRRQKKKQEEEEEWRAKLEKMQLPELVGTEKQVAWAQSIRNNLLRELSTLSEGITPETPVVKQSLEKLAQAGFSISPNKYLKLFKKAGEKVAQKSSATFWIDRRHSLQNILDAINQIILNTLKAQNS